MSPNRWIRSAARRSADKLMLPYVDSIVGRVGPPGGAIADVVPDTVAESIVTSDVAVADPAGVPSDFFHHLLHELRTMELDRVPKDVRRALSVGASGRWYFDWFEQHVGELDVHVGVEAFETMPDDLPDYVRWNATTAERFDGVDDEDIDLIFAGQTSEHLWADELAGFLLQSQRVLAPGGWIVLDSPNRIVTTHLNWSHGGHTVELSGDEISELLELAGFEVMSLRGVWRCRFGDKIYQLEDRLADPATLAQRIVGGPERPDDAFVWWVVARKAGPARTEELLARTDELFALHWPTRVCRGLFTHATSSALTFQAGGPLSFETLPFYLPAGRTRLGVEVSEGNIDELAGFRLELFSPGPHTIRELTIATARRDRATLEWLVDLDELVFAVGLRISCDSASSPVSIGLPLSIANDRPAFDIESYLQPGRQ